ncbi:MAG: ABC transporter ATP-binding protein [Actinobacteria bacterium]|nr:ABC transporter ATP-binding protein [Actinomycetota bacterium]
MAVERVNLREDCLRLWRLLYRKEKQKIFALVLGMFFLSFLDVLGIGLFVPIVQVATSNNVNFWPISSLQSSYSQRTLILLLVGSLVLVILLKNVLTVTFSRAQYKVQYSLNERIGLKVVSAYLNSDYLFHVSSTSPILIRNVNSALSIVSSAIGPLMTILNECLVVTSIVVVLLLTSPTSTLVATGVFTTVGFGYAVLTRKRLARLSARREQARSLNLKVLQEAFSGIREIKVFGREAHSVEQIRVALHEETDLNVSFAVLNAVPRLVLELAGVCGIFLMVTYMVITEASVAQISTMLIVFGVGLVRTLPSASKVLGSLHVLRFFAHSLNDVVGGLTLDTGRSPIERKPVQPLSTEVEVLDVSFQYPGTSDFVLKNVNLRLPSTGMVGVIGESGGGKSTFIDLILGLISPSEGSIVVGGVHLDLCRDWWLSQVGYVPQSVFLSNASIKSNIVFGPDVGVSEENLQYAYRSANLSDFISSLQDGEDTHVGERGARMSGGQVQRIGIARALYRRPKVLILDEPTSSLDEQTEERIMREVAELKDSMTILVVSHRPAALRMCDNIYRVQDRSVTKVDIHGKIELG